MSIDPKTRHNSDGGTWKKPMGWFVIGGAIFLTAWMVWTFFFDSRIP